MNKNIEISASIVLYKENLHELIGTMQCFLNMPLTKKLYIIDNTKNEIYKGKLETKDVKYISNGKNIGFGAGHNKIINEIKHLSNYHLILNPDVIFRTELIGNLIDQIKDKPNLAMIAPKVVFPDGKHQFSCRRYPSFKELVVRRFSFLNNIYKDLTDRGQYKDFDLMKPFFPEYLTGCFHLYKTEDFVNLKGFDERYFLYMEDVDICKKIDKLGKKKMYYPSEEITHVLKQGSSKSLKLFMLHTSSAIKYFLKWKF